MNTDAAADPATTSALAPAIARMLETVRSDAATATAAAGADAASRVAGARADAATILAGARADGAAAAQHATTATVIAEKRAGREAILRAQQRAYEALVQGVRAELARTIESPPGIALLARLDALARARLGPNARVERLDDGRLGVRASDGSRSLEVPVDRFVEHAIAGLGDRIAALWR